MQIFVLTKRTKNSLKQIEICFSTKSIVCASTLDQLQTAGHSLHRLARLALHSFNEDQWLQNLRDKTP